MGATFSKDDLHLEVQSNSADGGTNGPTQIGYYLYDSKTGKGDGLLIDGFKRVRKSTIGRNHTQNSGGKRFTLTQAIDSFRLSDKEGKELFSFPGDTNDRASFNQNDELLAISTKTGFHLYSTKTGKTTLNMDLGYRPIVGFSNSEKYLICRYCSDHDSLHEKTELIDLTTLKRLGPFNGDLSTFSQGDDYFANVVTSVEGETSRYTLELRKLPTCELTATFKNTSHIAFMRGGEYALLFEQLTEKLDGPQKLAIIAWDLRNNKRVWALSIPHWSGFDSIVGEDKVVYIRDDAGNSKILEIASGRTLFNFQDVGKRPEFANLNTKGIGFSFSHTSMRFVTFWRVAVDRDTGARDAMQVTVWKPVHPIE